MRQALLLKRIGQVEQALPLFEQVGTVEALVELAKYAEHHQKDINRAITFTEQAIVLAERKETVLRQTSLTEMRALRHRMSRLERKRS
ncbi:hypothetical protein [Exiguobacterium sp. AM39-5BH]|uniref:hypothetical protein n=1 Tax=Exiguobacterium sp. AM39-5BH TaxID=2292355 RepID=UPI001F3B5A4E|nr:hypothetical protein [Exiguobacterium sp. AM39-5BH]